jgi:hypothetical protein
VQASKTEPWERGIGEGPPCSARRSFARRDRGVVVDDIVQALPAGVADGRFQRRKSGFDLRELSRSLVHPSADRKRWTALLEHQPFLAHPGRRGRG